MPGRVVFDEERCKGCELCTTVCPRKIIMMKETRNAQGYRPATVLEMEKCTGCAVCAQMCPDVVIEVWREAAPPAGGAQAGAGAAEGRDS